MIVPPVANPMATKPVPRRNTLRLGAFAFIGFLPYNSLSCAPRHHSRRGLEQFYCRPVIERWKAEIPTGQIPSGRRALILASRSCGGAFRRREQHRSDGRRTLRGAACPGNHGCLPEAHLTSCPNSGTVEMLILALASFTR